MACSSTIPTSQWVGEVECQVVLSHPISSHPHPIPLHPHSTLLPSNPLYLFSIPSQYTLSCPILFCPHPIPLNPIPFHPIPLSWLSRALGLGLALFSTTCVTQPRVTRLSMMTIDFN